MCIATPGRLSSEIDTEVDTHRIIEITEGASTLMIEIRCQGDQGGSDERGPPVDDGSPVTCAPRGTPSIRRDSSPASYPSATARRLRGFPFPEISFPGRGESGAKLDCSSHVGLAELGNQL